MNQGTFRLSYVSLCALSVLFTFFFHELAHFVTGVLLGNEMRMSLNAAYPVTGDYKAPWHSMIVTSAGPLFTLLQAVFVAFLMRRHNSGALYPFLMTPLIMRTLAGGMNFISPNDEGRISLALGLGLFTIPLISCLILFFLVRFISKRKHFDFNDNANTVLLVIVFSSVLILSDGYFR